jgi:hypothetical protein
VEFGVGAVCESVGVQVLGVEEEESIFHPGCRATVPSPSHPYIVPRRQCIRLKKNE